MEAVIGAVLISAFLGAAIQFARGVGGLTIPGPALVLTEFTVSRTPVGRSYVQIVGRPQGIVSWIMSAMGLSPRTSFQVSCGEITFSASSLSGRLHRMAPLPNVASTHCGYSRSIGLLFFAVAVVVLTFFGSALSAAGAFGKGVGRPQFTGVAFVIGLGLSAIALVAYWLSKKMLLAVETNGGMVMGVKFKRSVIENIPVDFEKAGEAIALVNQLIAMCRGRTTPG